MNSDVKESLGEYENRETVLKGQLKKKEYPMGIFLTVDFSDLKRPGLYRIVLPDDWGRSYHFLITDGNFRSLIRLFSDFLHNWRSGKYKNEWRCEIHMDDEAVIDLNARAEWSSTKYWPTPLSNMLMALSILLPENIKNENKIGIIEKNK
jgi:hypothetical protein